MTVTVVGDGGELFVLDGEQAAAMAPTSDQLLARRLLLVDGKRDDLLADGLPVSGLHVALDNGSRADLGGMATTALAALGGTIPWPESYQVGWITVENKRIPLPTPTDGMQLAAAAGDFYARIRQHARDLKDQLVAAAAADPSAIDIEEGWPG